MKHIPSVEQWIKEAKQSNAANKCGMYLFHNGVVRATAKAQVRMGEKNAPTVQGLYFDFDAKKAEQARQNILKREGIFYARIWLNRGELRVGDDIMFVLIGGDIRPRVTEALDYLVSELKNNCVTEKEIYE